MQREWIFRDEINPLEKYDRKIRFRRHILNLYGCFWGVHTKFVFVGLGFSRKFLGHMKFCTCLAFMVQLVDWLDFGSGACS